MGVSATQAKSPVIPNRAKGPVRNLLLTFGVTAARVERDTPVRCL